MIPSWSFIKYVCTEKAAPLGNKYTLIYIIIFSEKLLHSFTVSFLDLEVVLHPGKHAVVSVYMMHNVREEAWRLADMTAYHQQLWFDGVLKV